MQLEPLKKDFFVQSPAVMSRSDQEVLAFRNEKEIKVFADYPSSKVPRPVENFEEAMFPGYILKELASAGFLKPTPIQCQG